MKSVFDELRVVISRVVLDDGREMHRLTVSRPQESLCVDSLFQTYNGAAIGLFRFLSNKMAAV